MDISLLPVGCTEYKKEAKKEVITDSGIVQLSDCAVLLLHKCGKRPLYLIKDKKEEILIHPQHKTLMLPDTILYTNTEAGKQSARVIQEQLLNNNCSCRMLTSPFLSHEKIEHFELFKNIFETHINALEKKGCHHIVILCDDNKSLQRISQAITGEALKLDHNIPIYSFSNGKEIRDGNLRKNLYITREMLDDCLLNLIQSQKISRLLRFKGQCKSPLNIYQIKRKLKISEKN